MSNNLMNLRESCSRAATTAVHKRYIDNGLTLPTRIIFLASMDDDLIFKDELPFKLLDMRTESRSDGSVDATNFSWLLRAGSGCSLSS